MFRLDYEDCLARRQALTTGLGWRVFHGAWCLSTLAFVAVLLGGGDLWHGSILALLFGVPALVLALAGLYWRQSLTPKKSWQEVATLQTLRVLTWLGSFWQILCLMAILLYWASGRGLLIWFPS